MSRQLVTFAELARGERFRALRRDGTLTPQTYTKVAKKVAKDAEGQWFNIALDWRVEREPLPDACAGCGATDSRPATADEAERRGGLASYQYQVCRRCQHMWGTVRRDDRQLQGGGQ